MTPRRIAVVFVVLGLIAVIGQADRYFSVKPLLLALLVILVGAAVLILSAVIAGKRRLHESPREGWSAGHSGRAVDANGNGIRMDVAYAAADAWGPDRTPRDERIRRAVSDVSDGEVAAWLQEFQALDSAIWRLAEAGGPSLLGNDTVRQRLQAAFPFLVAEGLRHAEFLVAYYAWHEGYDKLPRPEAE